MADLSVEPARTLAEVVRAFRVDRPLEARDSRYVDLKDGRGDDARGRLRRSLLQKQQGEWLHAALASHRGAGKTTELNQLRVEVADAYHVLQFEANVELNTHDLAMEDLLLVLCRLVATEMDRIGHPLEPGLLQEVTDWFASITRETKVGRLYQQEIESQAKIGSEPMGFFALFTRYQGLVRGTSEDRTELKNVLRRYPGALLDSANRLLRAAHQTLRSKLRKELLVVVDNMDRYAPTLIDTLLVRDGDTLEQLECNLIVTPPLLLVYKPTSGQLTDHLQVEVMPAFRLRDPQMPYSGILPLARERLEAVLRARMDLEAVLPDPAVRDRLYTASGGAVRELVELVGEASIEVDAAPIPLDAVERVVRRRKARLRTQININDWAGVLGRIGREKKLHSDPKCLDLLFLRFVFEYNGDGWYDLNPLVAEIDEVAAALAAP
jgi:hypothetical protein